LAGLVAVLDTNVLYPPTLRGLLLEAAAAGAFQPRWSEGIFEELLRHLRDRVGTERADLIVATMNRRFQDAVVGSYAALILAMTNSPKDRHVLAAVAGRADAIVTRNLQDFPPESLASHGIRALSPDQFAVWLSDTEPLAMVQAVMSLATTFGESLATILLRLEHHAPDFVGHVASQMVDDGV
jgi:predicted nucleic acid-binding protein